LEAIRLILDSTFFTFDNQIYKQNFETHLSSVIADIVMQELEYGAEFNKFLNSNILQICRRYCNGCH